MNQWVFLFTAFLLAATALTAQSEDDIFAEGAFDQAVADGQAAGEANKLVWLGGVNLASTSAVTLPTDGDSTSQSVFTGKGFLKASNPSLGALFVSYTFVQPVWDSTGRSSPSTEPDYTLSEFHLSFDLGKVVFLRLGNQLIDWGASAVWSPADFINRKSGAPDAPVDNRMGKAGLRAHVPWSGGNFFVFADASRTLGLKADVTALGWNLGLVGNVGKESDPRAGLTASGAVLGVDVWGEAGAVLPLGGRDLRWSASLGGEKSFGTDSEWTLRAEGFWNPDGHGDEVLAGANKADFTAFYWGRAYVYAEAVKKKLAGPDVTGSLSATANLADRSWTSTASLRTAFPGTVPFSVYTQYNGGEAQREFTLSTNGPAWTFGLRSVVEF